MDKSYTAFDAEIIMDINTVFSTLTRMGIGPEGGYSIKDSSATWTDYIGDLSKIEMLKTYVTLRTKLLFDPPQSSVHLGLIKEQIAELEWSLHKELDRTEWGK